MSRTLEQLFQEALDVQYACNLCGVAQSFAQAMIDLGEHCPNGTHERNTHPVTRLWVDKLVSLSQIDDSALTQAYLAAHRAGAK